MYEYRVVEGNKETFEKEMNRLANDGWFWSHGFNIVQTDKGLVYSNVMCKVTQETK